MTVTARLVRLVRAGPRELALRLAHRLAALVTPAHRTNASGNNQSQR